MPSKTPRQVAPQIFFVERQPRRAAVHDHHVGGPVRLAGSGDDEALAEGIA